MTPASAPVLVLTGPTGAGKTDVALILARRLNAEIISADSRQIHRGFSIGTAKPSGVWAETSKGQRYVVDGVIHHLVDFLPPTETYTAGRFARDAAAILLDRASRQEQTLVVGGTGLYLRALTRGLAVLPEADAALRAELKQMAEEKGRRFLHDLLVQVDPDAARAIPANNLQRVIRALEVHRLTGKPITTWHRASTPLYAGPFRGFLLDWPAPALEERLKDRCLGMIEGILRETKDALAQGLSKDAPAFQSLGYREAADHLEGRLSQAEFEAVFYRHTRAYVKRQNTWFRSEPFLEKIPVTMPFRPDVVAETLFHQIAL